MELTINGQVYQFNFGMGFMREMNKKVSMPVDGVKDAKTYEEYSKKNANATKKCVQNLEKTIEEEKAKK